MSGLRAALLLAAKDLRLERRTYDVVGSAGLFALLIVVTASFTLPAWSDAHEAVAAGTLWTAILFSCLLGVGRGQSLESENRAVDMLLLAPAGREYVFVGKLLAGLAFMSAVELVLVPALIVLMRLRETDVVPLLLALALGTIGLVGVGALFGMLAVQTRVQQPLLPVLVMPVVVPLMIASTQVTSAAFSGEGTAGSTRWLALLAGFDAAFLLVAVLTVPHLVEE